MLLLRGSVTRWVTSDPQPGLVEIEITDYDGHVHRLIEKSAVVDAEGLVHSRMRTPVEVEVACQPRHQEYRRGEERTVNVVDLSPWGVDDPATLYPVRREQLRWAEPAAYSDLSVCARQAVALVTFRQWREALGLRSGELEALEDHLWQFATVTGETFGAWYESNALVRLGRGAPLPTGLHDTVAACGLAEDDVTGAVDALIDITYGGLFGRIESQWSLAELEALGRITAKHGVPLAPADGFVQSLWVDYDWGRPDAEVVRLWRTAR